MNIQTPTLVNGAIVDESAARGIPSGRIPISLVSNFAPNAGEAVLHALAFCLPVNPFTLNT